MTKTILITGATDGIGLAAAEVFAKEGHHLLIHGRNPQKTSDVERGLREQGGSVRSYIADLSRLTEVDTLADQIAANHPRLDALINNAGVLNASQPRTESGLDVRFVVNTLAPYALTQRLVPLLGSSGRVINLSSAAQSPVNVAALRGQTPLADDMEAYSQSKLALTMWSRFLGRYHPEHGPFVVAVNPGSLLATKMVDEAFGHSRAGVEVGANILHRAATSDAFADASGKYFDNDVERFSDPHSDALDDQKVNEVMRAIDELTAT
ncbi:MAG: SDR family NAD(P)-dependent oxidoreductase [Myxococcota bacterium]